MSCRMALLRGLVRGLASHCGMTLVLVFISSYCAFCARNVYVHASHLPNQLWLGYWTDTKRRCKLRNKLSSFHPCIHASLPFLLVSVWLGAINKELHRRARTCYFSAWRRCLQICLLAYPQYATLHKFASRLVSQKNICVPHYRNEFFYFQENSFDMFLPYTAYYEDGINSLAVGFCFLRSISIFCLHWTLSNTII